MESELSFLIITPKINIDLTNWLGVWRNVNVYLNTTVVIWCLNNSNYLQTNIEFSYSVLVTIEESSSSYFKKKFSEELENSIYISYLYIVYMYCIYVRCASRIPKMIYGIWNKRTTRNLRQAANLKEWVCLELPFISTYNCRTQCNVKMWSVKKGLRSALSQLHKYSIIWKNNTP